MAEDKPNVHTRILITILCLFIVGLISYNFFAVDPQGEITAGLLSLIAILVVLVLSETFDNFSIGKLLSIQRTAKKTEERAKHLEKRNSELINQLISISLSQNQSQSTFNVSGDYHSRPLVEKATEAEVNEQNQVPEEGTPLPEDPPVRPRIIWRRVEEKVMERYLSEKKIHSSNVLRDAKLTTYFHGIDPVSTYAPIFDGYYLSDDEEVFVEFHRNTASSSISRDRIYILLTKINYYRNIKRSKASMDLVLIKTPEDDKDRLFSTRWLESFQPAITRGILRVQEIELTEEDVFKCRSN